MKRNINLQEITDGRKYGLNDLVKADCGGCAGCSACCHGMGKSIVLDPLDCYHLEKATHQSFEQLLADKIELNVVDGIILPNLKMSDTDQQCAFLNDLGRCSIHNYRPGICRIFPLGRIYENGGFSYVLQTKECPKPNKVKVKVQSWIDTENMKQNQQFIGEWHFLLKDIQILLEKKKDENYSRQMNLYLLKCFFLEPFKDDLDFYEQFEIRYKKMKSEVIDV